MLDRERERIEDPPEIFERNGEEVVELALDQEVEETAVLNVVKEDEIDQAIRLAVEKDVNEQLRGKPTLPISLCIIDRATMQKLEIENENAEWEAKVFKNPNTESSNYMLVTNRATGVPRTKEDTMALALLDSDQRFYQEVDWVIGGIGIAMEFNNPWQMLHLRDDNDQMYVDDNNKFVVVNDGASTSGATTQNTPSGATTQNAPNDDMTPTTPQGKSSTKFPAKNSARKNKEKVEEKKEEKNEEKLEEKIEEEIVQSV
jgi:hypothetical protein